MASECQNIRDWYSYPDQNSFSGFLLDVKTEIRRIYIDGRSRRVSGIVLFFLTDSYKKYTVFLLKEPYFLVTYHPTTTAQKIENEIKDVIERVNTKNQRHPVILKRIEQIWRHDTEHPLHRFLEKDTVNALKVVLEVPNDVPKIRNHIRKISGVKSVREDDILFDQRTLIDTKVRVGKWYRVTIKPHSDLVEDYEELPVKRFPSFIVFGWDIETLHAPLRHPDPKSDPIFMVQICLGNTGYLIINKAVIDHNPGLFEKKAGNHIMTKFTPMIVDNEKELINTFFWVLLNVQINGRHPDITSAHNSDVFDWFYLNERSKIYKINIKKFGVDYDEKYKRCKINGLVDIDTFLWVSGFSYSAKGEQGAKPICKKHLGYEPDELDHEKLLEMIDSTNPNYDPQTVCEYGASDAQITYLLGLKIVANFVFALSGVVAVSAADVLRKGASSAAELLYLSSWHHHNVIAATKMNKHTTKDLEFFEGYPVEKVSYKGADVQLQNVGIYRNDLDYDVKLNPDFLIDLINKSGEIVDRFCDKVELKEKTIVTNRDSIKKELRQKLEAVLSYGTMYRGKIVITHIDVKAMYPSIVLTYKLQPHAVVTPEICAQCDRNTGDCWIEEKIVKIYKVFLATSSEVKKARMILERDGGNFFDVLKSILKDHKKRGIRKIRKFSEKRLKEVNARFCQKAHDLFINDVRELRDLRYIYKNEASASYKKIREIQRHGDPDASTEIICELEESKEWNYNMANSLKTILNASSYGYIFREGSRALSIEVVGFITIKGIKIIRHGKELISNVGGDIELDTDGVHFFLPEIFPIVIHNVQLENGNVVDFDFLLEWINEDVQQKFTNKNYWTRSENGEYSKMDMCEIVFDIDPPVDAFLSLTKKKYAIVTDNEIIEIKGIEKKRKGELKFIKDLYTPIIFAYTKGNSLQEAYQNVYEIIVPYIKKFKDRTLPIDILKEARDLSKHPNKYPTKMKFSEAGKKYVQMGLDYVVGTPMEWLVLVSSDSQLGISDRCVPTTLFQHTDNVIRKWLKEWFGIYWKPPHPEKLPYSAIIGETIEDLIDWDHYYTRFVEFVDRVIGECSKKQGIKLDLPTINDGTKKPRNQGRDGKNIRKLDSFSSRKKGDLSKRRPRPKKKKMNLKDFI